MRGFGDFGTPWLKILGLYATLTLLTIQKLHQRHVNAVTISSEKRLTKLNVAVGSLGTATPRKILLVLTGFSETN